MNRDHKVYTFALDVKRAIRVAIDHDNSKIVGYERRQETVVAIATSDAVARAAIFENPFRYPDAKVLNVTETQIDVIVEVHTY